MKGTENHRETKPGDALEELFRHVSARERPPDSEEQAIRDALHAEWRAITGRRRRRRAVMSLAAAASLVLAVMVGTSLLRGPETMAPARQLASIDRVSGIVEVQLAHGASARAQAADMLESGQTVVTRNNSYLAFRWLDGSSVRMDQHSEFRLTANGDVELISGQIYVDSEMADSGAPGMAVLTPAGRVRHLGTQYMTAVREGSTTVLVRQGRVAISSGGEEMLTDIGERLVVSAAGERRRESIATYGNLWEWAQALAPAFSSDGRSMADFLDWVGHESGRAIEYRSPEAEKLARDTLLRGEVDMGPMRALTTLLQTSDLVSEVNAGVIAISLRPGGHATETLLP